MIRLPNFGTFEEIKKDNNEKLNVSIKKSTLIFTNKTIDISQFVEDTTYEMYPYKVDIVCEGVTPEYIPDVYFDVTEAVSGIFAPVATAGEGVVTIYALEIPEEPITIPSIKCETEVKDL